MTGFASEVKQVNAMRGTAEQATPGPDSSESPEGTQPKENNEPSPTQSPKASSDDVFNNALPVGESPVDPNKAHEHVDAQKSQSSAKIKIGAKEFDDVQAAMQYAEELEITRIQEQGFREGYEAAKPKEEPKTEARKALEEEVEEIFFENPKEALKKFREGIREQIFTEYREITEKEAKAKEQQAKNEALWTSFYTDNTDLSESRDVVEFLLKKNWDTLANLPITESLPRLAEIARKQLRLAKESSLPKVELQSRPAIMVGVSQTSTPPKAQATAEENMDFVTQLSTLRRRGHG